MRLQQLHMLSNSQLSHVLFQMLALLGCVVHKQSSLSMLAQLEQGPATLPKHLLPEVVAVAMQEVWVTGGCLERL